MTEIINKITSYNLFNYLVPGVLFAVIADYTTSYKFIHNDLVIGAFVYYFLGSVINRVGSLVIESSLKKIGFVKFEPYQKFVTASKTDPKLEALSETNNMFRTFIAMFLLLLLLKVYEMIEIWQPWLISIRSFLLIVVLLIMFLYSYKKQTEYITKRIQANTN